jgi:hypothetical protein
LGPADHSLAKIPEFDGCISVPRSFEGVKFGGHSEENENILLVVSGA